MGTCLVAHLVLGLTALAVVGWILYALGLKNVIFALRTMSEMILAFRSIPRVTRAVWVCGSARFAVGSPEYNLVKEVVRLLVGAGYKQVKIVNGGGPGAMGASGEGAHEAGGQAFGFALRLEKEETPNPWSVRRFVHRWFFVRKVMMLRNCEAVIFFRGGYGSLDELFEVLCMLQTKKAKKDRPFPVYLVDSEFWGGLLRWLLEQPLAGRCIDRKDLGLFQLVDVTPAALEEMVGSLVAHLTAGYDPTPEEVAAARKARTEHQWTAIEPYLAHVARLRQLNHLPHQQRWDGLLATAGSVVNGFHQ